MTTKQLIHHILFRVDSNQHFHEFLHYAPRWRGRNYWYALSLAYTCSDNLSIHRKEVKEAFLANRKYRESLMTIDELKILENLPSKVTIYRGMSVKEKLSGDYGVSWTLQKEIAEFFAYKNNRERYYSDLPKTVHVITIDKKDIIAYFGERKEDEIIYIYN